MWINQLNSSLNLMNKQHFNKFPMFHMFLALNLCTVGRKEILFYKKCHKIFPVGRFFYGRSGNRKQTFIFIWPNPAGCPKHVRVSKFYGNSRENKIYFFPTVWKFLPEFSGNHIVSKLFFSQESRRHEMPSKITF